MSKLLKIITLTAVLTAGLSAADRIAARNLNQQRRINQGAASGNLTKREALALESRQHHLQREIRRDRIDGGGLTPRERVKIERKQNALSRGIYSQKHDFQRRP